VIDAARDGAHGVFDRLLSASLELDDLCGRVAPVALSEAFAPPSVQAQALRAAMFRQ
jgi:hypothetical protein